MLETTPVQKVLTAAPPPTCRHPELVSGSISQHAMSPLVARWMLNQVQHDGAL